METVENPVFPSSRFKNRYGNPVDGLPPETGDFLTAEPWRGHRARIRSIFSAVQGESCLADGTHCIILENIADGFGRENGVFHILHRAWKKPMCITALCRRKGLRAPSTRFPRRCPQNAVKRVNDPPLRNCCPKTRVKWCGTFQNRPAGCSCPRR